MPGTVQAPELSKDREELRQRWYREGWFNAETVAMRLARAARELPNTPIYFHTEQGLRASNTREIVDEGRRLATAFRALGIRPGDVVAMQMATCFEVAALYVAAFFCGAVLLPIVHIYGPAEVGFILRRARAKVLIVQDRWRKIDYLERLEGLGELQDLEHLIVIGERQPRGALSFDSLRALISDLQPPPPQSADEVCLLLFTSGTTGEPKGVQQTHNTVRGEWEIPFLEDPGLFLNPTPAGHIQGFNFLLRPMLWGIPVAMMDRWDAGEAARLVAQLGATQTGGAPYFLHTLLDAALSGGHDLSSLKCFGLGGAAVTPEDVYLADRHGLIGGRAYGLSEHSTVSAYRIKASLEMRATTDGRIQPGTEVRVVDEQDRDVPLGTDGEILLRGPEQFIGYLDPRHDLDCYLDGGWFRTGDIGHLNAESYITITDRKKDLIIRGGENISSMEVENFLLRHEAVAEVAVVAMPDLRLGEKVCAFIVTKPQATLDLVQIAAHCAKLGLARQKTPERLEIVSEMPRTPTGKVKKVELRRRLRH